MNLRTEIARQHASIVHDGYIPDRIKTFNVLSDEEVLELKIRVGVNLVNNSLHSESIKQLARRMIKPLLTANLEGLYVRALAHQHLPDSLDYKPADLVTAYGLAFAAFEDTLRRSPLRPPV